MWTGGRRREQRLTVSIVPPAAHATGPEHGPLQGPVTAPLNSRGAAQNASLSRFIWESREDGIEWLSTGVFAQNIYAQVYNMD